MARNYSLSVYQKEAIAKVSAFIASDKCNAGYIIMPQGTGVTTVLVQSIICLEHHNVLVLFHDRDMAEQFHQQMTHGANSSISPSFKKYSTNGILTTTYNDWYRNAQSSQAEFDYIILHGAERLDTPDSKRIFDFYSSSKILGVFAYDRVSPKNIFYGKKCLYEMPSAAHIMAARNEKQIFDFVVKLMSVNGYHAQNRYLINDKQTYPDIVFASQTQETIFIEVKSYMGREVPHDTISRAIEQMSHYARHIPDQGNQILILLCEVDQKLKETVYEEYGFSIWDIANILYLCGENSNLIDEFVRILPYSITGISALHPYGSLSFTASTSRDYTTKIEKHQSLIDRLNACGTGIGNSTKYEVLCVEIIRYLFETEFSVMDDQHKTDDDMFRMDLLCGIKGTAPFWHFLVHYFRTKFVVFEFKNYGGLINQNLIYVTDKYLYNPVLRNVAIIISRNGFNQNAQKAAEGTLKENSKLIISIRDADLIKMLEYKADGKEPSDHLMRIVESMFMGISK